MAGGLSSIRGREGLQMAENDGTCGSFEAPGVRVAHESRGAAQGHQGRAPGVCGAVGEDPVAIGSARAERGRALEASVHTLYADLVGWATM